jgi:hypothetical protein
MDIAQGERAEADLDAFIERRSRNGETDSDEQEELWKASVRRYNARRAEEERAARIEYHRGPAARLKAVLEALIARHEEQATRLCEPVED